jgi:cytoplasmic iron level regulating protein YaaA (DUF328/UPF0246 family)
MPRPALVLIPPSLGKAAGGRKAAGTGSFDEALAEPRAQVVTALAQTLRSKERGLQAKVFGAEGELLDRAIDSARAVVEHRAVFLPAWRRYTGVVWANLEPSTLTAQQRRRLLVPSGLYGVTTGSDPVADYRLGMQGELGRLGSLRSHWKGPITELLVGRLKGRTVFNLLPAEHALAIDLTQLAAVTNLVDVRFVSNDGRHAVGHDAKAAKGQLVRLLLEGGITSAAEFNWYGWTAVFDGQRLEVIAPASRVTRPPMDLARGGHR